MSKKDSRKELSTVYRRCLSALNQSFKLRQPSAESCKKFEKVVAKEASERAFANSKEREAWVKSRYEELYHEEQARLFKDPNASLKAQIQNLLDSSI